MHMRVFTMARFVGIRRGRVAESQRLGALMTGAAVIVMRMMSLAVVRLREHNFPDAMSVAAFVGVRRRGRQGAEMRHSEHQKPSQEATKRNHAISLKCVCYRLLNSISAAPVWMIAARRKPILLIVRLKVQQWARENGDRERDNSLAGRRDASLL